MSAAEVALIIPAAGMGERLGLGVPKALYTVGGDTLLTHALQAAGRSGVVSAVVVAGPVGMTARVMELVQACLPPTIPSQVVDGGSSRQASVRVALAAVPIQADVILIHDAARCLTPPELFADVVKSVLAGHDAVVPGVPVVDTLKRVGPDGSVVTTQDRSLLRAVQTPQGFRRGVLMRAHEAADERGDDDISDDAGLVERAGGKVYVVPGHEEAFKVTRPLDLLLAEAVLARRAAEESGS